MFTKELVNRTPTKKKNQQQKQKWENQKQNKKFLMFQ